MPVSPDAHLAEGCGSKVTVTHVDTLTIFPHRPVGDVAWLPEKTNLVFSQGVRKLKYIYTEFTDAGLKFRQQRSWIAYRTFILLHILLFILFFVAL